MNNRNLNPTGTRKSNRYIQTLVFLSMFIIMVGFGIIQPILPYYAENMGATAIHLGLLTGMYAGLQFVFAPLWGRLSDRIGRKPVLLLGLFGFTFTFLGFGLSTQLWMLFLARGLSGFLTSATLPTVMAYIADTTDHESRGSGMSLLGSAMGLGTIFGPVIGGFLSEFGPSVPFFFASFLAFTIAIFGIFFLPESLSDETKQKAITSKRRRGGVLNTLSLLKGPIGFMLFLALLTSFGMAQMESTSALFYEKRIGAGGAELGVIYMVMGVISFFTQFVLVGRSIRRLGEQKTFMLSLIGIVGAFLLFLVISNMTTAILAVIVMGFTSSFMRPALNTMISNRTLASEQGVTLGVMNSYYALGRMFGPITGGLIFDHLGIHMPFLFAALVLLISLIISIVLFKRKSLPDVQRITTPAGK